MNIYLVGFIFYIAIVLVIGLSVRKFVKGSADFFVGGRRFSTGLLFTTLLASNIGAGSTVGVTGLGYKYGLSAWWWIGASAFGSLILAYTVGPSIWKIASKHNLYTLGDYMEQRYHTSVRLAMALMMAVGTLALFAGQLIGVSWIMTVVIGTSKATGVIIGAIVVSMYFVIGGLLSSTFVNVFQLIMILAGFILALPYSIQYFGGWQPMVEAISRNTNDTLLVKDYMSFTGIGLQKIIGYIFLLTPSFIISPGLIQKIFGAKDEQVVKKGTALNGIVQLVFAFIPVVIGMAAFAAFPNLESQEMALPIVMKEMLPLGISVIALAAIFAAEISTADAVLFMITSSFTKDIYATYVNKKVSDQGLLRVSRIVALVSGALGVLLALYLPSIISSLSIFYALMSVALTAPLLFGLYTKGAKTKAAFLSGGVGIAVTLWLQYGISNISLGVLTPQAIGMITSIFLITMLVLFSKSSKN